MSLFFSLIKDPHVRPTFDETKRGLQPLIVRWSRYFLFCIAASFLHFNNWFSGIIFVKDHVFLSPFFEKYLFIWIFSRTRDLIVSCYDFIFSKTIPFIGFTTPELLKLRNVIRQLWDGIKAFHKLFWYHHHWRM